MTMDNSKETFALEVFGQSYIWVLCAIGVPANTLAIVIVLSMQRMTPATLLIAALAFFDGSALISKLVFQKVDPTNNVFCKLEFMTFFLCTMANWILMYICLERFIAVCYPLKKLYLVTMSRTCILLVVTPAVLLTYLLPVYITMNVYHKNKCTLFEKNHELFWFNYHLLICEMLIIVIPYITIVFITTAIFVKLKFYARQRRETFELSTSASNSVNQKILKENERTERSLTIMLIFTSLFFILFTLPSLIHFIMILCKVDNEVFKQIKYFLFDSTHALNFFMYFLTAGRFRQRCHQLLCCAGFSMFGRSERNKKSKVGDDAVSPTTLRTFN